MTAFKPGFRYDINALRAIAVLGVILFHYQVPFLDGGFSGVDVFFVISGYLMTRIVFNELASDHFSVIKFYIKRVQRIIPALLFLVITIITITFFLFLPTDYHFVARNAMATLLFVSNIVYFRNDYFDAASDNNIFLHTWSLSAEWQFYIILPVLLLYLNKVFKHSRKKFLVLFVLSACSLFVFAVILTSIYPSASFYLLPTRAWEMLVGGIAFLIEGKIKWMSKKPVAIAGYIIIVIGMIGLHEGIAWPGFFTLFPIIGTFIVILSNHNEFAILKNNIVQFLGRISYSLYLWHWPVLVIGNYIGTPITVTTVLCYITISVLLASFSYQYVENFKLNQTKFILGAASILIAITGAFTVKRFNEVAFKKQTLLISDYRRNQIAQQELKNKNGCFISGKRDGVFNKERCLGIQKGKKNIILIGDSHANHFSTSFREILERQNIHLSQVTISGCTPILRKNRLQTCSDLINYVYKDFIPKNAADIDGVIISSNWVEAEDKESLISNLKETINYLHQHKIKVILLGQNETYIIPYTSIAAREYEYKEIMGYKYLDPSSKEINEILKDELFPYYINIYNLNSFPKLSTDNIPYMSDKNHFTKYGSDLVVKYILKNKEFKNLVSF